MRNRPRGRCWAGIVLGCAIGCADGTPTKPSDEPISQAPKKPVVDDAVGEQPPPVSISPAAFRAVADTARQGRVATPWYLRVRVEPGGCQGVMHKLDVDTAVQADDQIFSSGSLLVVVETRLVELVRGARIDFVDEPSRRGFLVKTRTWMARG